MSVFRRIRKGQNGGKIVAGKYTIEFKDAAGIVRRIGGFRDKKASEELERGILRLVALRAAGSPPDAEGARFLESVPAAVRDALAAWSVIDRERAATGKSLAAHIADWRATLESRNRTPQHVRESIAKVKTLTAACRWRMVSDVCAVDFDAWRNRKRQEGMSLKTMNHYLTAMNGFLNWLTAEGRARGNPLTHLHKPNPESDRRVRRKAFAHAEFSRLLTATLEGESHHGLTGEGRSLLYRLAVESGFRFSELRSLVKASFDFDEATVTIEG
ncbi:MAG: hypothetical protein LBE84_08870 [Planctomycetota bacterium]|jgi:integrase|nr:hypothetical protein [Planctomycetota bacterium]